MINVKIGFVTFKKLIRVKTQEREKAMFKALPFKDFLYLKRKCSAEV